MTHPGPLLIGHVCLHTDPYALPGSGDVGGMNIVVRQVSEAMAAAGHEVHLATRRAEAHAPPRREVAPGVTLHLLEAGPARPVPKGEHEDLIAPFARELATLVPNVDVWHAHHWFSGLAALGLSAPLVQTFHSIAAPPQTDLGEGERPESPGRLDGERRLGREADLVLANSQAEADTAVRRLGADPARVAIARPGVDVDLFTPAREEGDTGPGYAVVAARIEPLKGIDLAISALARVPEQVRPTLRIVGGATDERDGYVPHLKDLVSERGLARWIEFEGPLDRADLAGVLRGARMLLVPSHSETYGLVALEAAASGVPVIAAATGGLLESVADGVSGVLLPGRSVDRWAEAITRFAADPLLAGELGRSARAHALSRTWGRTAEEMVAAYQSVLHRVSR